MAYELARDGADNETIARRLGVSVETVRSHLREIYKRTGLSNRTELAVLLVREDILLRIVHRASPMNAAEIPSEIAPAQAVAQPPAA